MYYMYFMGDLAIACTVQCRARIGQGFQGARRSRSGWSGQAIDVRFVVLQLHKVSHLVRS